MNESKDSKPWRGTLSMAVTASLRCNPTIKKRGSTSSTRRPVKLKKKAENRTKSEFLSFGRSFVARCMMEAALSFEQGVACRRASRKSVGNVVGGAAHNSGEGQHSGGWATKKQEIDCMLYLYQLLCYHASVCKG
jgi:hypothetical protein